MKKIKRTLAAVLACAMAVSTSSVVFADAGDSTNQSTAGNGTIIEGITDVKNPVIGVIVPTSMAFSVDVYGLATTTGKDEGSQIYSPVYTIGNRSQSPVLVRVKAGLEAGDTDVKIKSKSSDIDPTKLEVETKDIYMEAVAAKITGYAWDSSDLTETATTGTDAQTYTYTKEKGVDTTAKGVVGEIATADKADATKFNSVLAFALEKATFVDGDDAGGTNADGSITSTDFATIAADDKGAAGYRFVGGVSNSKDAWVASDVTLHVVYEVTPLNNAAYTTLQTAAAKDTKLTGTNMIKEGSSGPALAKGSDVTFTGTTAYTDTLSWDNEEYTINTVKSVTFTNAGGTTSTITNTNFTYTAATKAVSIKPAGVTTAMWGGGTTGTMTVTFTTKAVADNSAGEDVTLTLNIIKG